MVNPQHPFHIRLLAQVSKWLSLVNVTALGTDIPMILARQHEGKGLKSHAWEEGFLFPSLDVKTEASPSSCWHPALDHEENHPKDESALQGGRLSRTMDRAWVLDFIVSPLHTYQGVPFRECIPKSDLFVNPTKLAQAPN